MAWLNRKTWLFVWVWFTPCGAQLNSAWALIKLSLSTAWPFSLWLITLKTRAYELPSGRAWESVNFVSLSISHNFLFVHCFVVFSDWMFLTSHSYGETHVPEKTIWLICSHTTAQSIWTEWRKWETERAFSLFPQKACVETAPQQLIWSCC